MTVSGQPAVTYTFDDADQLTQLVRGADTVSIGYDGAGRRRTVTLPGGIVQTYGYDSASQVTDLTYTRSGTTLGNLTYAYSPDGHPVHVEGSFARGDVPAAYGPVTYDAANRITAYTYDADGNLTSDGTASYTWNARGQLTGYSRTGLSLSFGYDGFGQRTSKTSGSTTTRYLYDGPNAVQELSGTTATANLLTGGVDEVFSRTTSAGTRSLLTDPLGSTIGVADTAGTVTGEYSYQPFGATTLSGDDAGNPSRFTGREDDGDGLYYYRSRYYSTATQRFVSEDPFGFAAGDTNLYAYVTNQPTGLVDPYGTKPQGSGGSGPVDVTVRWMSGMPKNQFNIKARQLQDLSDRGVLFKAPNPVARDSTITGRYKQQLIRRVFDQFGQTNRDFAEALRTRILTRMNPDHIWELQLGGPDVLANLHILDAFTNQRIGTQIWTQIMHLPDYTPIRIIIIGP
jgi:RHS repeat-associated protein